MDMAAALPNPSGPPPRIGCMLLNACGTTITVAVPGNASWGRFSEGKWPLFCALWGATTQHLKSTGLGHYSCNAPPCCRKYYLHIKQRFCRFFHCFFLLKKISFVSLFVPCLLLTGQGFFLLQIQSFYRYQFLNFKKVTVTETFFWGVFIRQLGFLRQCNS